MIIIGGEEPVSTGEELFFANEDCDISTSKPNSVIYFDFDKKKLAYFKELIQKEISVAIRANDARELIYICNLGAKYAIVSREDAMVMQKIIDNYLYDTKLVAIIYEEEDIEWAAMNELDGVLFCDEEIE